MTIDQTVIGVGIIGLGGAAVAMIPRFAINPKFEIRGAADLDPEILSRFQEDFPNAMVTTDAEKLCSQPGINLVYIASPNHLLE